MSLATDTLAFFRTHWADRMVDTCTIVNRVKGAVNTTTGVYVPTDTTLYTGACLVRPQSASATQAGEELVEQRGYLVVIPWNTTAVVVDGLGIEEVIVKVDSTRDLLLDVKELVVRNVRTDSYNTARKLDCEDNQGG